MDGQMRYVAMVNQDFLLTISEGLNNE